jgi:hypothetical protein
MQMAELNWKRLLDPGNGGPGEAPGYVETLESLRDNPSQRQKRKTQNKPKA